MAKFTIEFGPKATALLESLANRKEASRADIVRRAIELYDALDKAQSNGEAKVMVVGPGGREREVIFR